MKYLFPLFIFSLSWSCTTNETKENIPSKKEVFVDTSAYSLKVLEPLHERLTFKDQDKSLTAYIHSRPNKVDSVRKVVYLLPFGNMKPEVLRIIQSEVSYLKTFLQLDVQLLPTFPYDSIKKK